VNGNKMWRRNGDGGKTCVDRVEMWTACVGMGWGWGQFHGDRVWMGMLDHSHVTH